MTFNRISLLNAALPGLSCAFAAALSLSALAAPAAPDHATIEQQQEGPGAGNPMPMFFPPQGRPMMLPPHPEPGSCHGGELFCASVQTDNPAETIQKLNSILPATAGGHYRVRVSVERVPEHPMDKGHNPNTDTPPAPAK
ncbi:hypothetical protein [Acerihabitans arboris]|uniref:Uncharacterized protein n=1 Tax=Acerihabitans arboris TaxID=2691583 RepID=A0A845SFT3_9GAMM|nr:hypothetical protein [Acerihabitans arboris]NDL61936.1 hypothetical protein [Acerihabitans arboris]